MSITLCQTGVRIWPSLSGGGDIRKRSIFVPAEILIGAKLQEEAKSSTIEVFFIRKAQRKSRPLFGRTNNDQSIMEVASEKVTLATEALPSTRSLYRGTSALFAPSLAIGAAERGRTMVEQIRLLARGGGVRQTSLFACPESASARSMSTESADSRYSGEWHAAAEQDRSLRLLFVVNPHSGDNRGRLFYDKYFRLIVEAAGLQADVRETNYAGHAIEIGKLYDPSVYEGICVIGGDGTLHEVTKGLLLSPQWHTILRRTPLATVKAGTTNAIAMGLRTEDPTYVGWLLVKRKLRSLDGILVTNGVGLRSIALCVAGWGIASAVASSSETLRSTLGVHRYTYAKATHGLKLLTGLEQHSGSVEYSMDIGLTDSEIAMLYAQPLLAEDDPFPLFPARAAPAAATTSAGLASASRRSLSAGATAAPVPRPVRLRIDPAVVARFTRTPALDIVRALPRSFPDRVLEVSEALDPISAADGPAVARAPRTDAAPARRTRTQYSASLAAFRALSPVSEAPTALESRLQHSKYSNLPAAAAAEQGLNSGIGSGKRLFVFLERQRQWGNGGDLSEETQSDRPSLSSFGIINSDVATAEVTHSLTKSHGHSLSRHDGHGRDRSGAIEAGHGSGVLEQGSQRQLLLANGAAGGQRSRRSLSSAALSSSIRYLTSADSTAAAEVAPSTTSGPTTIPTAAAASSGKELQSREHKASADVREAEAQVETEAEAASLRFLCQPLSVVRESLRREACIDEDTVVVHPPEERPTAMLTSTMHGNARFSNTHTMEASVPALSHGFAFLPREFASPTTTATTEYLPRPTLPLKQWASESDLTGSMASGPFSAASASSIACQSPQDYGPQKYPSDGLHAPAFPLPRRSSTTLSTFPNVGFVIPQEAADQLLGRSRRRMTVRHIGFTGLGMALNGELPATPLSSFNSFTLAPSPSSSTKCFTQQTPSQRTQDKLPSFLCDESPAEMSNSLVFRGAAAIEIARMLQEAPDESQTRFTQTAPSSTIGHPAPAPLTAAQYQENNIRDPFDPKGGREPLRRCVPGCDTCKRNSIMRYVGHQTREACIDIAAETWKLLQYPQIDAIAATPQSDVDRYRRVGACALAPRGRIIASNTEQRGNLSSWKWNQDKPKPRYFYLFGREQTTSSLPRSSATSTFGQANVPRPLQQPPPRPQSAEAGVDACNSFEFTPRGFIKHKESGSWLSVVAISIAKEAVYGHPSDGLMDLVLARRGSLRSSASTFMTYLGNSLGLTDSDPFEKSPIIDYLKVRSIVISPDVGQENTPLNVDGETMCGPGPYRLKVLPSLFTVYGEY
jgi:diacylglycerol kinase family enzyme